MDLKEAIQRIQQLESRVLWRTRLLALQDALVLSLLITSLLSAVLIIYIRLRPVDVPPWVGVVAILATVTAALVIRWVLTRPTGREAAFAIDERLNLEDRITTARAILERGGPDKTVEIALIEDAATRIDSARASSITPHRVRRWYALSIAAMFALGASMMIPQRTLPGAQELAVERAEIQSAGEKLEQTSNEVEQLAPSGSETAMLAREQADLGRALRRSADSRAEVLRKLSTLQDRIRVRRDELAETRADEVVTLAEQRLRSAVAERPRKTTERPQSELESAEIEAGDQQTRASDKNRPTGRETDATQPEPAKDRGLERVTKSAEGARNEKAKAESADRESAPKDPVGESDARSKDSAEKGTEQSTTPDKAQSTGQSKTGSQPLDAGSKSDPQTAAPDKSDQTSDAQGGKTDPQQSEEKKIELPGNLAGAAAEQAAKVLPSLSQELLKKAAQLRANELKPEDIKRLQQSAQFLTRDLEKIAQSKELQRALRELARQVSPEQLEQVARELANNEQLKRELEAAARLMMENQQTKQAVAGLAQELAEQRDQFRRQRGEGARSLDQAQLEADFSGRLKSRAGGSSTSTDRVNRGGRYERARMGEKLNAQVREEKMSGKLQRGAGGEYLYLQAKPGAGASRAAYSSAYPQYRREAERSVERSQVPPRMRSVVRDYFDAINPDVQKKP